MISALHNGRMAMRVLPGQAEEPPDVSLSAIESIVGMELECAPDPDIEGSEPISYMLRVCPLSPFPPVAVGRLKLALPSPSQMAGPANAQSLVQAVRDRVALL